MKGGGVGFYVNENLSLKISEKHTTFILKIFECLSIEKYPSAKKPYSLEENSEAEREEYADPEGEMEEDNPGEKRRDGTNPQTL